MRRWFAALALASAAVIALSGCVRQGATDGDLTDDWPALRAPTMFVPATDACLPRVTAIVQASTYETVDCARNHLAEAVHVGFFTGAAARGPRPSPVPRPCAPPGPSATSGPDWSSAATGMSPG